MEDLGVMALVEKILGETGEANQKLREYLQNKGNRRAILTYKKKLLERDDEYIEEPAIVYIEGDYEDLEERYITPRETVRHSHIMYFLYTRLVKRYPLAKNSLYEARHSRILTKEIKQARQDLVNYACRILAFLDNHPGDNWAESLLDAIDSADWDLVDRILLADVIR